MGCAPISLRMDAISRGKALADEIVQHILKEGDHAVFRHVRVRLDQPARLDNRVAVGVIFEDGIELLHGPAHKSAMGYAVV